ncbi:hypothetical protein B0A52_03511 [Exophiala mesophila]|uniref:Uncharacterized protein n=1 Tax=Exophiala mesophila TaxID=212818 RepID=A0A438N670_EXOME|nr:hypothetical protein B0A52_03511 [Exophiala mesophila]
METAPLTLAHTHARNAALESRRSNPVAASEEHDLAAAEFATAAQATSDMEAFRILTLLEQHHKRLGQLLKVSHEKPAPETVATPTNTTQSTPYPLQSDATKTLSSDPTALPPRLPRAPRSSNRDLSSSIASNLASARGIPNPRQKRPTPVSPLVSNQHADGQITQDDRSSRRVTKEDVEATESTARTSRPANGRPPWAPPSLATEDSNQSDTNDHNTTAADAPFQQFYTSFESLMSKLSAPLAFASLPLTGLVAPKSQPVPPQTTLKSPKSQSHPTPHPPSVASSVDYSQLISKAALRAVSTNRDTSSNPSESFYVVPTTGGTISYADIMSRAEREESRGMRGHHRQPSTLSNISEDDFVDAQSTLINANPRSRDPNGANQPLGRFRNHGPNEAKVGGKTMEELALENKALKHLSDTLSRRLHMFEMSSQTATTALAQSVRSIHRSPLTTPMLSPENSRGKNSSRPMDIGTDESLTRRIVELEDILKKSDARARKKDDENAKLRETINKYKEKWESLKAGAKARRERERRGGGGNGNAAEKGTETGEAASVGTGNTGDDND